MNGKIARQIKREAVDGLELEYELRGSGEPVVLIHWGVSATWAEPLMDEPALADRRLLNYHRAGFAGSDRVDGPIGIADHAAHCARLMRRLDIERAHVAGHSSSALIALQLALDAPDLVHTLVLMEPARPVPQTELQAAFLRDVVAPSVERYRAGDKAAAVDLWARGVFGAGYRDVFDVEQSVVDADAFFTQELPALQAWGFTDQDAARIKQRALIVQGANTQPSFPERVQLVVDWLPNAERFELPEATHLLHLEQPRAMAEAMAAFFTRNPLSRARG